MIPFYCTYILVLWENLAPQEKYSILKCLKAPLSFFINDLHIESFAKYCDEFHPFTVLLAQILVTNASNEELVWKFCRKYKIGWNE